MSDPEQTHLSHHTLSNTADEELSLPKATVQKLINDILPKGISCPRETRDLLIECCVEFVHLVSGESNEICENAKRKTISPEHIVAALQQLGFADMIEEVEEAVGESVKQAKEKEKNKTNKLEESGLTQEELIRQQEELFNSARLKYNQSLQGNNNIDEKTE